MNALFICPRIFSILKIHFWQEIRN